ncbi:MAG: phenylalanine--tRNA ligase subunit beta [Myxococcota bacterium]
MLVPVGWLSEWIDLPDTVEELADHFTAGGLEVDSIERSGPDLSPYVVGRVVEREPHPDADRLSLCRVDVGEPELSPIVCGAPNVAAGQSVAVARPGTRLPDGKKLKKTKIRGVESLGMICSARELGLSDEHEGILVLDTDAAPGTPLDRAISAGEVVLEIAITANRGDCASLLGMAREVRAHFGGALRWPETAPDEGGRDVGEDVRVEIEDAGGCHRYAARVVRGVRVGPSPDWLRQKLESAGLRSINNVVDVTNLVLLELGQPLHAFDLAHLEGGVVRVRSAAPGERLETLDGEQRTLEAGDLVIADGARAVALAGVMGGAHSEVSESTRDVLIESAHFHPRRVRRTARRLGLSSDASYRFERGVDRNGIERAADRAARLIAELAGGEVSKGIAVAEGSAPEAVERIALDPARVTRLLGTEIAAETVVELLGRVEIEATPGDDGTLDCRVPSHRNDIAIPEDLIEEVARIHGYDRIEPTVSTGPLTAGQVPATWPLAFRVREVLSHQGLVEVMSFPFLDPADLDGLRLPEDDPRRRLVRVLNPIVESEWAMRTTLLASLLRLAHANRSHQVDRIRIFEVARSYQRQAEGELPAERLHVGALVTRGEEHHLWESREPAPLFFEAKGLVERLLGRLQVEASLAAASPEPYLHPGASCQVRVGKQTVGRLGEVHPEVARHFGLDVPTALVELDLTALEGCPRRPARYREVSRHPRVVRDLAVLVGTDRPAGEIMEAMRKKGGEHLQSVELFDRYEGKGVPDGKVSLAFRLVYQRTDRTLTDAEVAKSVDRVVQLLANRFDGALRSERPGASGAGGEGGA